jgi:hypothetical protein
MSAPPKFVSEPDPSAYEPRPIGDEATAAAVAGAQELLAWMRAHGYRAQSIQVGPVQVIGVCDDFPRRRAPTPSDPSYED